MKDPLFFVQATPTVNGVCSEAVGGNPDFFVLATTLLSDFIAIKHLSLFNSNLGREEKTYGPVVDYVSKEEVELCGRTMSSLSIIL